MLSKAAAKHHIGAEPGFQWRGDEITRVEGLSDAVFAFAVTLLVVSLEVPKTFDEFYLSLAGLPSFAMTFMLLMFIWYEQYTFFRRYGLQDRKTVVLTLFLLFVVLFYVYPLKFLFTAIFAPLVKAVFPSIKGLSVDVFGSIDDVANLMVLYNLGVLAIWGIFYLLYRNAHSLKDRLELNEIELHDTVWSMRGCLFFIALGSLGAVFALTRIPSLVSISGVMYGPLSFLFFTITGSISGKKRTALLGQFGANV